MIANLPITNIYLLIVTSFLMYGMYIELANQFVISFHDWFMIMTVDCSTLSCVLQSSLSGGMKRCMELLNQTSRSFSAVIQALDGELRWDPVVRLHYYLHEVQHSRACPYNEACLKKTWDSCLIVTRSVRSQSYVNYLYICPIVLQ